MEQVSEQARCESGRRGRSGQRIGNSSELFPVQARGLSVRGTLCHRQWLGLLAREQAQLREFLL